MGCKGRMRPMAACAAAAMLMCLLGVGLRAHVTVWPQESKAGASERYVVRVPTEGKVATSWVELEVPADVTVSLIGASNGWTYELKRQGDRIVGIIWRMTIGPGEFAEFPFIARNSRDGQIVWKAHQHLVDGTTYDFVGEPGARSPAPVTKLTAP